MALLTGEEDEAALQTFLTGSRDPLGRPLYDAQYALRLARQRGHLRACVHLYTDLNLFEASLACSLPVMGTWQNSWRIDLPWAHQGCYTLMFPCLTLCTVHMPVEQVPCLLGLAEQSSILPYAHRVCCQAGM